MPKACGNKGAYVAECEFSKSLWNRLQQWLQRKEKVTQTWEHHLAWAIQSARGKSQQA